MKYIQNKLTNIFKVMMELISFNNNLHNLGSFHFVPEMIFIKNLIIFCRKHWHINLERQTCCIDDNITN